MDFYFAYWVEAHELPETEAPKTLVFQRGTDGNVYLGLPCGPGGFVVSSVAKAVKLRGPSLSTVTLSVNQDQTF